MAKYDVFPNPDSGGYLLDVQTDLLDGFSTRVVVPLMALKDAPSPAERLNPVFEIDGKKVVMLTQLLSAVPLGILNMPIGKISSERDRVTAALDMMFQGF